MSSQKYRVSKEIILNIAEHCDLRTLSSLTQTSKDIHNLVTQYEHSIAGAKIAASSYPPQGLVLSSEDEQRCTIAIRNSFATVRELDRRSHRSDSLLNRGSFLLTSDPKILGMTQESLDKFKVGLHHALHLADQLSDLATNFTIRSPSPPTTTLAPFNEPPPLTNPLTSLPLRRPDDAVQHRAATALRHAQIKHIQQLSSRELAWLVTLALGASKGFARYSKKLLETDPAMADARVMAFKEVLLRYGGTLVVWGFMRGTGTLAQFVKQAVAQCAEEVLFFEGGGQVVASFGFHAAQEDGEADDHETGPPEKEPAGLHMSIMQELNRRVTRSKKAEAEKKGETWDEDEEVGTIEVWEEVNKLVAREVGCASWRGYHAIKYPSQNDEAEA